MRFGVMGLRLNGRSGVQGQGVTCEANKDCKRLSFFRIKISLAICLGPEQALFLQEVAGRHEI